MSRKLPETKLRHTSLITTTKLSNSCSESLTDHTTVKTMAVKSITLT